MWWFVLLAIFGLLALLKNHKRIELSRNYKKGIKKFQIQHKLSDSEIDFFKETMDKLKNQIIEWEDTVDTSIKLKKNPSVQTGIKSAEEMFKYFVDTPRSIIIFNDFLYIKLPGALSAAKKFKKVEDSKITTEEVKESLNTILNSLIAISNSITEDYEKSLEEDISDIEITKRMVEKHD